MWARLVLIAAIVLVVGGCNPFEGTVFELRAPEESVESSDPNTANDVWPDWPAPITDPDLCAN